MRIAGNSDTNKREIIVEHLIDEGYPLYARALSTVSFEFVKDTPLHSFVAAVNAKDSVMLVNDRVMSDLSLASTVVRHELLHILLKHQNRLSAVKCDFAIGNTATDLELSNFYNESDEENVGYLDGYSVSQGEWCKYKYTKAEDIIADLLTNRNKDSQGESQDQDSKQDGSDSNSQSGAGNQQGQDTSDNNSQGAGNAQGTGNSDSNSGTDNQPDYGNAADFDDLFKRMCEAAGIDENMRIDDIARSMQGAGNSAASAEHTQRGAAVINNRAALRKLSKVQAIQDAGQWGSTYRRLNKKYSGSDIIIPGRGFIEEAGGMVFYLDVSGSMSQYIPSWVELIQLVHRKYPSLSSKIKHWDTTVREPEKRIKSGGTDIICVFNDILENKYKTVAVFSDFEIISDYKGRYKPITNKIQKLIDRRKLVMYCLYTSKYNVDNFAVKQQPDKYIALD